MVRMRASRHVDEAYFWGLGIPFVILYTWFCGQFLPVHVILPVGRAWGATDSPQVIFGSWDSFGLMALVGQDGEELEQLQEKGNQLELQGRLWAERRGRDRGLKAVRSRNQRNKRSSKRVEIWRGLEMPLQLQDSQVLFKQELHDFPDISGLSLMQKRFCCGGCLRLHPTQILFSSSPGARASSLQELQRTVQHMQKDLKVKQKRFAWPENGGGFGLGAA